MCAPAVGGATVRRSTSGASASRRKPHGWCLSGATRLGALTDEGLDHYAVAMLDPEGNEFDIN